MNKLHDPLEDAKYYPDRFYINVNGFELDNLTSFLTDLDVGKQQGIYIHEYYHYLTNISTFAGTRQFVLNFCDRFRIVCNRAAFQGMSAFPLNSNKESLAEEDIKYWEEIGEILQEDDLDFDLAKEVSNSASKQFIIENVQKLTRKKEYIINGTKHEGARLIVNIKISGLVQRDSFDLSYSVIDEFLSSAIDEYLIEYEISDANPGFLTQRPFYPYRLFDELLRYYGFNRVSAFHKILILYVSIHSETPSVILIEILRAIKKDSYEVFEENPETYLEVFIKQSARYEAVLNQTAKFARETKELGKVHISQALFYYYDKFYSAQKFKEIDFFYFIRPFLVNENDKKKRRQKFMLCLARIINEFTPPIMLREKTLYQLDKITTFGEATLLIMATYEIFESLKTHQYAKRPNYLKKKYDFPDNILDCDNENNFKMPPLKSIFQIGLNELGLYNLYLKSLGKNS